MPEAKELLVAPAKLAPVTFTDDKQALHQHAREQSKEQSSALHREAISFFQEGKPEVTHRTTRMPSSKGKALAQAAEKEEREQPSSMLLDTGFAEEGLTDQTAAIPTKLRFHSYMAYNIIALSTVTLVAACYVVLTRGWKKYGRHVWKLYFRSCGRKSRVDSESTEAPKSTKHKFRSPALPEACTSFVIPLVPFRASIEGHMSFDITERERGAIVCAALTRLPGRDAWAKIEFSMRGEASSSEMSPFLSCSRMESDSDIEARNVEGALDSWLSLLYHDKTLHDEPQITGSEQEDSQSENEQALHGCEEGVTDTMVRRTSRTLPSKSKKQQPPSLAIKDGMGNISGTIEADTAGRYSLLSGGFKLDIDTGSDGKPVAVSKDGKKSAVATFLTGDANTELAHEEQADFLQVDSVIGPEDPQFLQVLMCVLAPMAFNR